VSGGKPRGRPGRPAGGSGGRPTPRPSPSGSSGRAGGFGGGLSGAAGRVDRAGGRTRGADRPLGGEQIEGRRAVRELLHAGRRAVRDVWISDTVELADVVAEIIELADNAGVPVRQVARARLDAEARTDAPQGVLAHARALEETALEVVGRVHPGETPPFLLVLDGVTDPQNLGALLRTAELAGVTGIVLPRHRSAHITPAVAKAAAGAIEYLPIAVVPGVASALSTLRAAGVWAVGLDAQAPVAVWDLELATEPLALVVGAEGAGLSRLTRERCEQMVAVPQLGHLDSMNVAAAGAVAAFEVARRRARRPDR